MPTREFGLGNSIVRALGLDDSLLPDSLVQEIARHYDESYKITVGADSTETPCARAMEDRFPEGPGEEYENWPKPKPGVVIHGVHTCCALGAATVLPAERTNSITASLSAAVFEVEVSLKGTIRAQIVATDKRGNCPQLCTSEALGIGVMLTYEIEWGLSGSLSAVRDENSADRTVTVPVPDKVNFGPTFGEQDVWDWWGWNEEVGFKISKDVTLTDTRHYTITCDGIVEGTLAEAAAAPAGGGGVAPAAAPPVPQPPTPQPDPHGAAPPGAGTGLPVDCSGLSGPPPWERRRWLPAGVRRHNNCYNYACNIANNSFAQPGLGNPDPNQRYDPEDSIDCEDWRLALDADGLDLGSTDIDDDTQCGSECHRIGFYLAVRNGRFIDFHVVRQDDDGLWSHKPGRTRPKRVVDSHGRPVRDLADADLGVYDTFCGYACVCKCQVHLRGV